MGTLTALACSVILNLFLLWYLIRLLRKFFFVSEGFSDLFLTMRSFEVFTKAMYSMDAYHGEPMIQELMLRIRETLDAVEEFRDIFEYTLDAEIEEELNDTEEEDQADTRSQ